MMIASKPIAEQGEEPALAITKASRLKQRTPYVVEPEENRVSPEPVSGRSRGTGDLGITTVTRSKKRSDIVNGPPYVLEAEENRVSPEPVLGRSGGTGALGITTATPRIGQILSMKQRITLRRNRVRSKGAGLVETMTIRKNWLPPPISADRRQIVMLLMSFAPLF